MPLARDLPAQQDQRQQANAMLKVSANQMDYAAATSLYTRSLGLLKTAIGKR